MANKPSLLVDLNVILDVGQHRQPFYAETARVAAHSVTTLFYVIGRLRERNTAVSAITSLLTAFTVAAVDDNVIRQAMSWGWSDFEDAVQMAAAAHAGVDYLITRNPRDFKGGVVPVVQPAALLTLLE